MAPVREARLVRGVRARRDGAWLASARHYLMAALGCAVFSAVYESFSHGVYSSSMVLLFAYPLFLGSVPAQVGYLFRVRCSRLSRKLWACATMTLAMGSCLRGVLEIYGTTSPLVEPYLPVGVALLALAVSVQVIHNARGRRAASR